MTQVFKTDGTVVPVTRVQAGPCIVTQVRTKEADGYEALQLGFDDKKAKSSNKALDGHFKKAGTTAKKKVVEFQEFEEQYKLGDSITVEHFAEGEFVDVSGVSKGKGFQGVVKRHGFHGGPKTHGQSDRHRAPGSVGAGTSPGRVFKGKRMAGHMGNARVTVQNLKVVAIDTDKNTLMIKGAVPGSKNGLLLINRSTK